MPEAAAPGTAEQTASTADRPRVGRAPATTSAELSHVGLRLFIERGFDEVTVDEIAQEAGIGRRTFFRYFPSKNDLPWGDFGMLLERMRDYFAEVPPDMPMLDALRLGTQHFNTFPEAETPFHKQRMQLLLNSPSLVAHSAVRYADWRRVVAEFVADRLGLDPPDLTPQTVAWACLGVTLSAYERWLADDDAELIALIDEAFGLLAETFRAGG
ncbi:mycofactocin system transcriptional regulator [Agromyces archimandritae]|uniref:Mycofactocin system transcriptional regulator n=2 Tax=Agromyces archimandritae TaxID=2781962 RepID=A0A975FR46_9MICO|nr:mycofactocin system transcriptional regulator [Agromyces archimandritae]